MLLMPVLCGVVSYRARDLALYYYLSMFLGRSCSISFMVVLWVIAFKIFVVLSFVFLCFRLGFIEPERKRIEIGAVISAPRKLNRSVAVRHQTCTPLFSRIKTKTRNTLYQWPRQKGFIQLIYAYINRRK